MLNNLGLLEYSRVQEIRPKKIDSEEVSTGSRRVMNDDTLKC